MKKALWAAAAIVYLAGASAAFAAEPAGAAAGNDAGTISTGATTAVGIGVVGALAGIAVASSSGGGGSNTAINTTVATAP